MSKWLIGLLLFLPAPASADNEEKAGRILSKTTHGNHWFVSHGARLLQCETRRPCDSLVVGTWFMPAMNFTRSTELVEYFDEKGDLTDCMLRECRDI